MHYEDLDAIAVTRGPGMGLCLDVGLTKAKKLVRRLYMNNLS